MNEAGNQDAGNKKAGVPEAAAPPPAGEGTARLVIAAPHGRSGKTTVSLALIAALRAQGYRVQPFKRGPDYIDPGWLSQVAGRQCRNLDRYFCTPDQIGALFRQGARGADLAIIEGAMGLFDGMDLTGSGSTAEVARLLAAPVVLVVDATRMTRSVAALVKGFCEFDPRLRIGGVILNNVAGQRHQAMLEGALAQYCGLPVLGVLPKSADLRIPDRHLGLLPAVEAAGSAALLDWARQVAADHFDLERILALAQSAGPLPPSVAPAVVDEPKAASEPVRIGYFRDAAFHFYYPENLAALEAAGAELLRINALTDPDLPEVDALYLGGGFPEVFGAELAANGSLRAAVRQAAESGLPIYAECGGMMYLCRTLTYGGQAYPMAGVLPADVVMRPKPQGHGYTKLSVVAENPFFPVGSEIRGHEFHQSTLVDVDERQVRFAFSVRKGSGIDGQHDGLIYRNVLAGYNHLHAWAVPGWAPALVRQAAAYRQTGQQGGSPPGSIARA